MKEIYWVMPEILAGRCGPALTPWQPAALHQTGIRGVVSLDPAEVDGVALTAAGIDHLPAYFPMSLLIGEAEQERFLDALPPIFEFIDRMRRRSAATLVHCHYGMDRTGAVLACYLVRRERFRAIDAIDYVRKQKPSALLAPGYAEAVHLFEKKRERRRLPRRARKHRL